MLIFGDTNISLLNSMGQHFHSLLSNRRVLNKEANNLLTLGFGIYVNNVTTFSLLPFPSPRPCTDSNRAGREGPPGAVFSLLLTQNLASVRVERSGCGKPQSPFPLPGSLTPVGTFVLMIGKHTLPYFVFPGIDFRRGQGI